MKNIQSNVQYQIVALVLEGRDKAAVVDGEIEQAGTYEAHRAVARAVVELDDKGKPHIHEAGHGILGAGLGLVAGGALGLIGGPAGVLTFAIAGAVIGGYAGRSGGRPISTEDLNRLAARMQPDSSAILALVEETDADALVAALAGYEGQIVVLAVSEDDSGELHVASAIPGESRAMVEADSGDIHHASAIPGQVSRQKAAAATDEPTSAPDVVPVEQPPVTG